MQFMLLRGLFVLCLKRVGVLFFALAFLRCVSGKREALRLQPPRAGGAHSFCSEKTVHIFVY